MISGIPYSLGAGHVPRPEVVAAIRDSLCRRQRTCIVDEVSAAVGMGKTQLAIEYALRFGDQYTAVFWIRGSRPPMFTAEFSALANQLGLPEAREGDQAAMIRGMHDWLARSESWLLVVDDAPDPDLIAPHLDAWGDGHVLITSRAQSWPDPVEIVAAPPLAPPEIAALGASSIGDAPGWWSAPLTADLAAAFCRVKQFPPDRLAALIQTRGQANGNDDPTRAALDETVGLHLSNLANNNPAAGQLAIVCAHLDGGRIPIDVLRAERAFLPSPLRQRLDSERDAYALFDTLQATRLVQRGNNHLVMHPLTQQAVLRTLSNEKRSHWALHVIRAVQDAFPHEEYYRHRLGRCSALIGMVLAATERCIDANSGLEESGILLNQAGQYLHVCGDIEAAQSCFLHAAALAAKVYGPGDETYALRLNNLAVTQLAAGEYEAACATLEEVYRFLRNQEIPNGEMVSEVVRNLANAHMSRGAWDDARRWLKEALAVHLEAHDWSHAYVAECLNHLGTVFLRMEKPEQARKSFDHAVIAARHAAGCKSEDLATYLVNLGGSFRRESEYADALACYEEALELDRDALGDRHDHVVRDLLKVGRAARRLKDYSKAVKCFEEAFALRLAIDGGPSVEGARVAQQLGHLYAHFGDNGTACNWYERAVDAWSQVTEPEMKAQVDALLDLGEAQTELERWADAEETLKRALAVQEELDRAGTGAVLTLLGKLAEHQKRWQEALELHRRAIAVNTEMHGAKDESVGTDSLNIGHCLHRLGREIEAIPHAARAERIFSDTLGRDHSKTKLARSAIENWRA